MRKEVIEKLAVLITAAFGLIAALAWNEAIKSLFVEGAPLYLAAAYGIWIYAIVITAIAVIVTIWVSKLSKGK